MKILVLFAACFIVYAATCFSQTGREFEDPTIFRVNQTEPHTPLAPFDTAEEAIRTPFKKSPYLKKLNGAWKFNWAPILEEAPVDFYRIDYDVSGWDNITVPGNWQMQGFGHPKFRNVHQPFPANPPLPPSDYNPVGSYRTTFTVPANWDGRRIFLHFEAVKSAAYVWLNGQYLGFNQGGMEPFEFDVTDKVRLGDNVLAVRVFRYSAETYLECQDMWRLSGIYRDVYLFSTPPVHIRDYFVRCDLDKSYRDATLLVDVDVTGFRQPIANHKIRLSLLDKNGAPVFTPLVYTLKKNEPLPITLKQKVRNPAKWSAEYPNLYMVVLELLNSENVVLEALSCKTGFRKTEIINSQICVNGVPIKFNGVNSHVHHPKTGRAMDVETMRRDLTLMKQFNINNVRTSHYPPNIEYLQLADELGMYIVDETNDESHATEYVSEDTLWESMYIDRVTRMVLRDRNHPSIVFWSAGNESGYGDNIAAVIKTGKRLDPSRPIWMYGGNFLRADYEDVIGPRYPTHVSLDSLGQEPASLDPRPSYMDEYVAATGNSLGMLDEYWELIYKYPRLTGGAIWDWVSPGITQKVQVTPGLDERALKGYIFGKTNLVNGIRGKGLALSGHDEWVELYRDPRLDFDGSEKFTLSLWLFPRRWNGHCPLITKGDHQYGLRQANRDSVEFWVFNGERISAFAPVPKNWEYAWHHLAGVFDGFSLKLYLDGELVVEKPFSGSIENHAFPVAIGKNVELHGQEHDGQLCNAIIDEVKIFADAIPAQELLGETTSVRPLVQLAFNSILEEGEFFSRGIGGRSYGLVWPDRTVQPELYQLKKTPQPVKIEWADEKTRTVKITNRHNFTNLSELVCQWRVEADEQILQSGELPLNIPPHAEQIVQVPFENPQPQPGVEYRLFINFTLPEATSWAPKGHEVAWEQLPIKGALQKISAPTGGELTLEGAGDAKIFKSDLFEYSIAKGESPIRTLKFKNATIMTGTPLVNFWRAPIANELERDWGPRILTDEWHRAELDNRDLETSDYREAVSLDSVVIQQVYKKVMAGEKGVITNHVTFSILPSGDMLVKNNVSFAGDFPEWIPRIGFEFTLPEEFDRMSWYGRGPFETYPDRKTGAKVGVYSGSVAEQFVPYLIPQENGNKTDVRWAAFTNKDGLGLFIAGDTLLNVSASHYSLDNLDRAEYPFQLVKDDRIHVFVDYLVSGVGETPVKTLEKYRVKPGQYEFTIRLRPFDANDISPLELGRQAW